LPILYCENSTLIINQQNNRGETALLHCLIKRKAYYLAGKTFISIVQELLERGADPELGNKEGITPLMAAYDLKNDVVIDLIKQAIQNKRNAASRRTLTQAP